MRGAAAALLVAALLAVPHGDARVNQRARATKNKISDAKESRAREAAEAPMRAAAEAKRRAEEEAVKSRQRDTYGAAGRRLQTYGSVDDPTGVSQDPAPAGQHYMPDGTLMNDDDHESASGTTTTPSPAPITQTGGADATDDTLAARNGEEWSDSNVDLLDLGSDGWDAATSSRRGNIYGDDYGDDLQSADTVGYSREPAEIQRVDNLALAQFVQDPPPGYHNCACHNNPYMLYKGADCFDPWHLAVAPSCPTLCSCHGFHYDISPAIQKCVNISRAADSNASLSDLGDRAMMLAFPDNKDTCLSGSAQQCLDDVLWVDQDGDGCAAYATFADPGVACNYDGYTEALINCPVTCGSCNLLGLTNASSTFLNRALYSRMFNRYGAQRSTCGYRNNLGTPESEFLPPRIYLSGTKSAERCASACFEYVVDGKHACVAYSVGAAPNTQGDVSSQAIRRCV